MPNQFGSKYGRAELMPLGEGPEWAETVCTWLLTAPWAHPLWSNYILCVVRLRDIPGFPPPKRHFIGATHELLVIALNPEYGPFTVTNLARFQRDGNLPYLTPVNIAHQLEGTDEEAAQLAELAAKAVTNVWLCPETADAPDRIRADWKASLVKTLAHIRGEAHAS